MIEPTWIAYVAGFFDGEGSVVIFNDAPDYRLRVSIAQRAKDRDVLDHVVSSFGGTVRTRAARSATTARGAEWSANAIAETRRFLTAIAPYAIVKRAQVLLAIEYLNARTLTPVVPIHDERGRVRGRRPVPPEELALRASFRERMRVLNRVGPQVDAAAASDA